MAEAPKAFTREGQEAALAYDAHIEDLWVNLKGKPSEYFEAVYAARERFNVGSADPRVCKTGHNQFGEAIDTTQRFSRFRYREKRRNSY